MLSCGRSPATGASVPAPAPSYAVIEEVIAADSTRLPGNFHAGPTDRAILSYAANGYLHALDAAA